MLHLESSAEMPEFVPLFVMLLWNNGTTDSMSLVSTYQARGMNENIMYIELIIFGSKTVKLISAPVNQNHFHNKHLYQFTNDWYVQECRYQRM